EEPQEQPADRAPMPDEELQKILEAHRKWVESEEKDGKRAGLYRANLERASLYRANLQGAFLRRANLQGAYLSGANLQGAFLRRANLQGAFLRRANLQGAFLADADGLTVSHVKTARNWELAFYSDDFLKELGLPPDHNEKVKRKLAEMERKKKATGGK
ncbi:MAG: pentapeptide repeat-containing protein, partial [candidate division NC10 bacterium]